MLANRSMPQSAVVPVLAYEDVGEAVDWLCETFGFVERWRAGNHRAQVGIGDAAVAVTGGPVNPGADSVMVRVEDLNAHHERAQGPAVDVLGIDRRRRPGRLGRHLRPARVAPTVPSAG